jgi:hypothetical protein
MLHRSASLRQAVYGTMWLTLVERKDNGPPMKKATMHRTTNAFFPWASMQYVTASRLFAGPPHRFSLTTDKLPICKPA